MANLIDLNQIPFIGGKNILFTLAFILSGLASITLLVHTYHTDVHALVICMVFVLVPVLFENFYGKWQQTRC